MNDHVSLVKSQIGWLEGQVSRFTPNHPRYRPAQVALYQDLLRRHASLLAFLQTLPESPIPQKNEAPVLPDVPLSAPRSAPVAMPDDLADLPPELLNELSDTTVKGETEPLVKIIAERGGSASLDEILIDLYRKYGEIGKRTLVANKLYRLSKRGFVWAAPGRKGIYTTSPHSAFEKTLPATETVISLFDRPGPVPEPSKRS